MTVLNVCDKNLAELCISGFAFKNGYEGAGPGRAAWMRLLPCPSTGFRGNRCAFTFFPATHPWERHFSSQSTSWATFTVAFPKKAAWCRSSIKPAWFWHPFILVGVGCVRNPAGSAGLGVLPGTHVPCAEQIVGVSWLILMGGNKISIILCKHT